MAKNKLSVSQAVERDLRLDFFRGLGLWMIFLDHIPDDFVGWLTLRNYGFSDAAEFFVFISGYLAGYIYGPIVQAGNFLAATKRLWTSAGTCTSRISCCFCSLLRRSLARPGNSTIRCTRTSSTFAIFSSIPTILIGQALTLRYKPVDLDVLPLYISFDAASPFFCGACCGARTGPCLAP